MYLSIIIGLVAIYAFLNGYREIEILVGRGSYYWVRFKKWLYWFTDQNSNDKNEDSFHTSNGIATVIISIFISWLLIILGIPIIALWEFWATLIANAIICWLYIMYIRNVTMHVLIPKWEKGNPKLMLWYLLPLIGKFIQRRK